MQLNLLQMFEIRMKRNISIVPDRKLDQISIFFTGERSWNERQMMDMADQNI